MGTEYLGTGLRNVADVGLATAISGEYFSSTVNAIRTSGYSSHGAGAGFYVSDALATSGLATAHPLFCKQSVDGRYWRLLPDDQALIPVACAGVVGFSGVLSTQVYQSLATFSAAPFSANGTLSDGGAGPPASSGNATLLTTAAGGNYQIIYMPITRNVEVVVRVKGGTSSRIFLYAEAPTGKGIWVNPSAGTITQDDFGTASITSLGSGWYDVRFTADIDGYIRVGVSNGDGSVGSNAGDTFYLYDLSLADGVAAAYAESTNDCPEIQAAINYCEAIGAQGTRYDSQGYSLWRNNRTLTAVNDIHADKSGLLLQTTKSHKFISTCGGSTLYRRDDDGSAMGIGKFDSCTGSGGYKWRGGGIFVEGQTSAPADVGENSIYLYDMVLDGGITDSSEQDNPFGAFMDASGDGWDVSDKGIWQSNDRYCGHIVLEGRSAIRYFMGELIYGSGVGSEIARRKIRIGPDVELGHTCGSGLNGNGQTLDVDSCLIHDAYIGVEGWTGELGGFFYAKIYRTEKNSIQGGIPNFGGGSYFAKSRATPDIAPIGELDVFLKDCAQFDVGSWLIGRITSVDCYPTLGNGAAFPECKEVDLHCITIADQVDLPGGVAILGGATTTKTTDRVHVTVDCKRTDYAVANSKEIAQAVYYYGSFGPDVVIDLGSLEGTTKAPAGPAGTVYDYPPAIRGYNFDGGKVALYVYNIETNHNATVDLKAYGNVIFTSCTNNGTYNMNLPTTGVPVGYRLFIHDWTKNFVAGGATCKIPAANFRTGANDLTLLPGYGYCELEFDGSFWSVVVAPPGMVGVPFTLDTDTTLAANSDTRVASQKAIKAYVDAAVTGVLDFKGATDCSANPNYPAASKGDVYIVSVAGKIGGASGKTVDVGDMYLATADNAGGTEAGVGTNWAALEHNIIGGGGGGLSQAQVLARNC